MKTRSYRFMRLGYIHYKSSSSYRRKKYFVSNRLNIFVFRIIERLNQFLVSLPFVRFYFLIFFEMTFITMSCNSDIRYDKLVHDKMRKNYIYNFISAFMLEKNDENLTNASVCPSTAGTVFYVIYYGKFFPFRTLYMIFVHSSLMWSFARWPCKAP